MKKLFYIGLLFTTVAQATVGDGGCQGNCDTNPGVTPNVNVTPTISPVISPTVTNVQGQDQRQTQSANAVAGSVSNAAGGAGGAGGTSTSNATGGNATGGAGGSATSTSAGGNASNNGVSTTVNNVSTSPEHVTVKTTGQAPDILTTPTAPCRIAVGVSAGWLGGALGLGGSVEDEGCTLRENARLLHNFGEKAAALALMCNDAKVAAVLSICPKPEATPTVKP